MTETSRFFSAAADLKSASAIGLRHKSAAAEKNLDVSVKSAGLFAPENGKASLYAVEALFEKNIALNHTSSQLSEEKVEWADLI